MSQRKYAGTRRGLKRVSDVLELEWVAVGSHGASARAASIPPTPGTKKQRQKQGSRLLTLGRCELRRVSLGTRPFFSWERQA